MTDHLTALLILLPLGPFAVYAFYRVLIHHEREKAIGRRPGYRYPQSPGGHVIYLGRDKKLFTKDRNE